MKTKNTLLGLIAALALSACQPSSDSAEKAGRNFGPLLIEGSDFKVTAAPLYTDVVETSIVSLEGKPTYLPSVNMLSGDISIDRGAGAFESIESATLFAYVLEHEGAFFNFYKGNGGIFAKRSSDLKVWEPLNGGRPVLTEVFGSDHQYYWNPGVAVDDRGVWHLLVECGREASQADVGLCSASARMDSRGELNFDSGRIPDQVIRGAGNPWLEFIPDRGLLAVYGKVNSPEGPYDAEWFVKAAVLPLGASDWEESQSFRIGAPSLHVCDPHLIETPEGTTLLLSYDQWSVYELKTPESLTDLFDRVAE